MSNPDSSTPSIQALNLAVKPAGHTWQTFMDYFPSNYAKSIALAYAADLDKADKVGREIQEVSKVRTGMVAVAQRAAALILPEPIDPDLLEAEKMAQDWRRTHNNADDVILAAIKRGRELAKERGE